jgi:hypothetical protein
MMAKSGAVLETKLGRLSQSDAQRLRALLAKRATQAPTIVARDRTTGTNRWPASWAQ